MIIAKDYCLNTTLVHVLQALHKETKKPVTDIENLEGLTGNLGYILQQTAKREMPYNAFQIRTAIPVSRKDLPAVGADTHRPHHYIKDIETIAQEGIATLDLILPLPLEFGDDALPYALAVKTYPTAAGTRVSGLTVNLGDNKPCHIFLYVTEVCSLAFGDAVAREYPLLLPTREL